MGLLLRRLRARMAERGARGIIGLGRAFRIFDDDGSRSLSFSEWTKAMRDYGLALAEGDARLLFDHFDRDGSGSVDYNEFLLAVRVSCCARVARWRPRPRLLTRAGAG